MKTMKIILLVVIVISLAGCSFFPVYHSDSEVKRYVKDVFGTEYNFKEKKVGKNTVNKRKAENKEYQYTFENKDGHKFTMYSGTCHSTFLSNETNFYETYLDTDYIETKINMNLKKIDKMFDKYAISYDYKDGTIINLYLENQSEIENAAKAIEELDEIIGLDYDESKGKISCQFMTESIVIYIKPDLIQVSSDWKSTYDYTISYLHLSSNREEPIKAEKIEKEIKKSLVAKEKNRKEKRYYISDSALDEYKANLVRFEVKDNNYIDFYYDEDIDDYYTSLGICLNYDLYSYNQDNSFKYLVEYLGGRFYKSGWTATWTIGNNTWDAEMFVNSKYEYKDMIINLNGKKLNLSGLNSESDNIFRRQYTVSDLEKLLNAEINIKQEPLEVEIKSK